jgi:hypothetical protein
VSESGDTTTSSPLTVGIQLHIPLASPREQREYAQQALAEATRIDEVRGRALTDLAKLRELEAALDRLLLRQQRTVLHLSEHQAKGQFLEMARSAQTYLTQTGTLVEAPALFVGHVVQQANGAVATS